jgi:tellurite resistance protein
MESHKARPRRRVKPAQVAAAYLDFRDDELFDASVSIAALVARADGWVQEVERRQLLDFLDENKLLTVFAREDVDTHFEHCVRELRQPDGQAGVIYRLRRHAKSSIGPLLIRLGEAVAAADCRLDPREGQVLLHVRRVLAGQMHRIERAPVRRFR